MKQFAARYLFLLIILCSAAFAQGDPTVYVTRTGTKYHTSSCSYLRSSSIPMKLSEAKKSYSACSRCKPDVGVSSKTPMTPETQSSTITPASGQTGTTRSGAPIYTGPRGGQYHYSKSGKKVYERRKH